MADADESNTSKLDADSSDSSRPSGQNHDGLAVAEYVSLRSEIVKLIELQSQLISLAVVAAGAILGVAVQVKNPSLAFVYPPLALILEINYLNHSHGISRCAKYLSQHFEPRYGGGVLGWERFVRRNPLRFGALGYWGVRSVFMNSSLVATIGGWTLLGDGVAPIIFGVFSSLVTLSTIALLLIWRESSPQKLLAEEMEADRNE